MLFISILKLLKAAYAYLLVKMAGDRKNKIFQKVFNIWLQDFREVERKYWSDSPPKMSEFPTTDISICSERAVVVKS